MKKKKMKRSEILALLLIPSSEFFVAAWNHKNSEIAEKERSGIDFSASDKVEENLQALRDKEQQRIDSGEVELESEKNEIDRYYQTLEKLRNTVEYKAIRREDRGDLESDFRFCSKRIDQVSQLLSDYIELRYKSKKDYYAALYKYQEAKKKLPDAINDAIHALDVEARHNIH